MMFLGHNSNLALAPFLLALQLPLILSSQNTPLLFFLLMNFQWLFDYTGKPTQQEALP